MTYDPFARGSHPVGVRSLELADEERSGRPLPTEVYYPAADEHQGADLDPGDTYTLFGGMTARHDAVRDATPAGGPFPLIGFSHGFVAHRRQSTFLLTHLASHGYVVAAGDHTGNTSAELMAALAEGKRDSITATVNDVVDFRPKDLKYVVRRVASELGSWVDAETLGLSGHSAGGWTALTTTAQETRTRAVVALAPAGLVSSIPNNPFGPALDLDWGRDVPTVLLVADRDSLLPLDGMRGFLDRIASLRRMVVLRDSDHFHFCDSAESMHEVYRSLPEAVRALSVVQDMPAFADLCPEAHGHDATRGLALAAFDAHLRDRGDASAWLDDVGRIFDERGIRSELLR